MGCHFDHILVTVLPVLITLWSRTQGLGFDADSDGPVSDSPTRGSVRSWSAPQTPVGHDAPAAVRKAPAAADPHRRRDARRRGPDPLLDVPAKYAGNPAARAERPMFSSTEDTDLLPRTPQHRRQPTSAARDGPDSGDGRRGRRCCRVHHGPAREQAQTRTVLASEDPCRRGRDTWRRGRRGQVERGRFRTRRGTGQRVVAYAAERAEA